MISPDLNTASLVPVSFRLCESNRDLKRIPDLPAIPLESLYFVAHYVVFRTLEDVHRFALFVFQLTEEALSHCFAVLIGEGRIIYHDVDTRDEGFVKGANSVGRKEEDALVVFERS